MAEFYGCTPEVRQELDSEEYLLFTAAFHAENGKLVFRMTDGHGLSYFGAREVTFAQVTGKDSNTRATKWFDYLAAPDEMDWSGRLEINLPEFPEVTFRWYPEKIEAVTSDGITPLYTGMPIWNAYFCDLTGDGLPELCSTLSFGSGMIDNRVIIYDYGNGVSHTLEDRGNYDYTLRLNDSDGRLYAEQKIYNSEELVASGPLVFQDGRFRIEGNTGEQRIVFQAKLLEIHDSYYLVEPAENSLERNSASRIEVPMKNMSPSPEPQVGDILEIAYNGEVLETFPGRLVKVFSIRIVKEQE